MVGFHFFEFPMLFLRAFRADAFLLFVCLLLLGIGEPPNIEVFFVARQKIRVNSPFVCHVVIRNQPRRKAKALIWS